MPKEKPTPECVPTATASHSLRTILRQFVQWIEYVFARIGTVSAAVLLSAFLLHAGCIDRSSSSQLAGEITVAELPVEAQTTIAIIGKGGPFPYAKDGSIFFNREGLLPKTSRGYYREYTVPTPGVSHRGARRIVTGERGELYYTGDHYRSFWRIRQ